MLYPLDEETGNRPKPIGNYHKIPDEALALIDADGNTCSILNFSQTREWLWLDNFDKAVHRRIRAGFYAGGRGCDEIMNSDRLRWI